MSSRSCLLLRVSLLRRNGQGDDIARIDRHFLTHWSTASADWVSEKPDPTGTTNQVPWNGERIGGVTNGETQPDSLAAIDGIDYHITEALILNLDCRGVSRLRPRVPRAAGAGSRCCKHHDERGMDEEGHGDSQ